MLTFAEAEYEWQGGLDGIVGFEEWKSLIATGERMIQWQSHVSARGDMFGLLITDLSATCPQLPGPWLMHLSTFLHPKCPSPFQRTFARRTFDRALRSLPPSLHGRIWGLYLRWAEQVGGIVGDRVWRRLLKVITEVHMLVL